VRLGEKPEDKEDNASAEGGATEPVVASPQAMEVVEDKPAAEAMAVDAVK
jgi:hypothetical protein